MAHILVVEDEPHIRFLVCKVLEAAGHTTDEAGDGLEALHAFRNQTTPYALVVSDYQMPKMDGYQLIHLLRRQSATIPVILLTVHRNLCDSAREYGANGALMKPFGRKQLVEMVNRLIIATPKPFLKDRAARATVIRN